MEVHARKKVATILFPLGLCAVLLSESVAKEKKKGGPMLGIADQIWNTMVSTNFLDASNIAKCRADNECLGVVTKKFRLAGKAEKVHVMPKLVDLGGQWHPSEGDIPDRIGPYLIEERLVALVVETLHHEDPALRDQASRILVHETPDSLVRNHVTSIEKALMVFPDLSNGVLLLGKLGSQRALEMLRDSKALQSADALDVQAAYGKLGAHEKEAALVTAYRKATEPREKRQLAWYLGYVAKPASVLALARDLRSPFAYEWNQKAKRSFRIHVISALSMAYPREPLLWQPFYRPDGDEYYARIESWAEKVIGVEWAHPRPAFLYEEEVPMRRPAPPR